MVQPDVESVPVMEVMTQVMCGHHTVLDELSIKCNIGIR